MWINYWIINIFWLVYVQGQSPILDSRCYLEGGGSAENFLASEDVAVGTVIGTLRINGDPTIDLGDILLSLRERDSPVKISPGSKDLVLVVPLDKEGVRGPSSIYVNVICDRRHSTDPSFVVPVNIRVTDVNDNAPQWIGAPYSLSLSEVTVPGTRVLQGARAVDQDQQGPFSTVEYNVLPGPFSDFVSFVTPQDGTLVLKKPLDFETLRNFTVKLRAQDQGNPPKFSDTQLRVTITDSDDQNPKFLKDSYRAELPMDGRSGELKITPEPIRAIDQDVGLRATLQFSINPSSDSRYFTINPRNGLITLINSLGPADLLHGATLVVKATQLDNPDRYALTTVIVSRKESSKEIGNSLAFIQSKYQTKVREDLGIGSRILALPTNRPGRSLRYLILDTSQSEYFTIGSLGEVVLTKSLDYETSTRHKFKVLATDGLTNTTADVNIEVLDVNDWEPRFRQSHYEFSIPKEIMTDEPVALGKMEAADGDRNDRITLSLRGPNSELFNVDSRGTIWLKGEKPNVTIVHLMGLAVDSGVPAKSSSVPVSITTEGVTVAQAHWAPGVLGAFGAVLALFILVVLAMTGYIVKSRKSKSRNRVHSHAHSTTSAANLVNHEKGLNGLHLGSGNMRLGTGMNGHGGSESSISAGASTILAASLEREAQRERDKDRENYTATVRSIISRASAARGGSQFYDGDIERDSISNSESPPRTTWGALDGVNGGTTRVKKLSWGNDDHLKNGKTEIAGSTDNMGSTENNLTVYF